MIESNLAKANALLEVSRRVLHSSPIFTGERECVVVAQSDFDALRKMVDAILKSNEAQS